MKHHRQSRGKTPHGRTAVLCLLAFGLTAAALTAWGSVWVLSRMEPGLFARRPAASAVLREPAARPEEGEAASTVPDRGAPIRPVPVVLQNPELPAGCEATSAAMLLAAYGYDTDKLSFAAALPKRPLELHNGLLYGPRPSEAFIGSPDSPHGFGVFAAPVVATMQAIIDEVSGRHRAADLTGAGEDALLSYLDRGIPVCVWTTIDLLPLANKGGWYIKNGDAYTGEYYTWPGNEHCVVLIAYDQNTVTVHDPLQGVVVWERSLFFQRHAEVGGFAVVLEPV